MKRISILAAAAMIAVSASAAGAACVTKGAVATSNSEQSAKWFVLETIVQQVDWGAWPSYVATNKPAGYAVKNEHYRCSKDAGGVTCHGQATLCKM